MLPLERRVLGDPAAALVWRHALPCLLADASFAESARRAAAQRFAAVVRARRLETVRRAAALVSCELALANLVPGADPHGLEALYCERVEAALGRAPDESRFLVDLMGRTKGNVSAAARISGTERRHLGRLLKKHGIPKLPSSGL
jgi:transcriptional regulator of acetoin/glycerol metabolism